ncbi:hypothetical protein [Methylorubrum thiocyanatum]|uniref:hypothetical protein n=1 Tax=Methylorubrum thiocyanatum TaxID=47958 RepID=UPI003F7D2296
MLQIVIPIIALTLVALLALQQTIVFVREYRFYRRRGWDFTADSGLDRIDQRITHYPLRLTNWQRLFVFRPLYLLNLYAFLGLMIWAAMG